MLRAFSDLAEAIEVCPRGCGHMGPPADPECALDALSASVPGRPGMTAEAAELAAAREEIERLRATVTEQAVALHLHQGKSGWD